MGSERYRFASLRPTQLNRKRKTSTSGKSLLRTPFKAPKLKIFRGPNSDCGDYVFDFFENCTTSASDLARANQTGFAGKRLVGTVKKTNILGTLTL